jgi:hypothetical protein
MPPKEKDGTDPKTNDAIKTGDNSQPLNFQPDVDRQDIKAARKFFSNRGAGVDDNFALVDSATIPKPADPQAKIADLVQKISAKVDDEAREGLTEFVNDKMPNLRGPQLEARLRQLSWVNDQVCNLSVDDASMLAQTFTHSELLIPAYMAGVRDKIPAGRIEIFVHGTSDNFARQTVDQNGGTLSGNGGDHSGRLFTTPKLDTGREFAQRLVSRQGANDDPALIGVALPEETVKMLKRNNWIKTREIHDRPGQIECIFEPQAIQILKDKGFFFHLEGPTAEKVQRRAEEVRNSSRQEKEGGADKVEMAGRKRSSGPKDYIEGDGVADPRDVVATGSPDFGRNGAGADVLKKGAGKPVGEEKDTKDIDALEREILNQRDGQSTAEQRRDAILALEMAKNPGNAEANRAVREVMKERERESGGEFEGKGAAIAMVIISLAGWYATQKARSAPGKSYTPAPVS